MNRKFGRVPSPLDIRDYNLKSYIPRKFKLEGSKAWPFLSAPLDQKDTPHCVGFSMADWGINLPVQSDYDNEDGHNFYYLCKIEDGEPKQENGSNLRSAAKVLQDAGRIDAYAWATTVDDITYWLLNNGPVIVGTWWTEGMMIADEKNVIHPTGAVLGGHAYILNEKTVDGFYGIQNSWGSDWGVGGRSYISITDFAALLRTDGEAIASVELPLNIPPENEGCLARLMKLFGE